MIKNLLEKFKKLGITEDTDLDLVSNVMNILKAEYKGFNPWDVAEFVRLYKEEGLTDAQEIADAIINDYREEGDYDESKKSEALSDYGFRLGDTVKLKDVTNYGQIGTIVDWSDELRQCTVEFGKGQRAELNINDIEIIE